MEELSKYLEMLTTAGGKELDKDVLKKVKNICKTSEENVKYAFHVIMVQLNKEHSEIRYSALLVINELFKRSHIFRKLLLSEFQEFLELTAETNQEHLLPPPKATAKNLRIKTLELVQEWNNQFGEDYKRLKLGYNFLRDCKKVDFANLHARSVIAQTREQAIQRQQAKIIQDKVNKVTLEMAERTPEIKNILNQMENCFRLLLPFYDDLCADIDLNMPSTSKQSNFKKPSSSYSKDSKLSNSPTCTEGHKTAKETERYDMLRHHGLHGTVENFSIEVTVNPQIQTNDNTADLIDNLKDLNRQVEKSMLPSIEKWIQILTKGSNCTAFLKKAIDLKNSLVAAKDKFKDLKILPQSNGGKENSDDEGFEAVEDKEGYEPVIPSHLRKEYGLEPLPSKKDSVSAILEEIKDPTSYESNVRACYEKLAKNITNLNSTDNVPSTSKTSTLDPRKAKMLSEAPHLPYDIDLYHWEEKKIEPPSIVKFDSLHRFWQPYENETTEIQDKEGVAALRMRKIDFSGKFVPVKWKCRAPLPSGKLCPRQDRYKCPFHGEIIPRDETGKPTSGITKDDVKDVTAKSAELEVPEWQDPEFLKDLEACTGINLEIPKKRAKQGPAKKSTKKKRTKYPNLTDIDKAQNTARKRLEKKIFKKGSFERIAEELNELERKKHDDKFGNQWVYSFNS